MSKLAELTSQTLNAMTDQSNTILSKLLMYVGVSGSSAGIVTGVVQNTQDNALAVLTTASVWTDHVGIICGIGGFSCLAIKTATDVYFSRKKDRREQEVHDKKLKDNN